MSTDDWRLKQRSTLSHRYTFLDQLERGPFGQWIQGEDAVTDAWVQILELDRARFPREALPALASLVASDDALEVHDNIEFSRTLACDEDGRAYLITVPSPGDSLRSRLQVDSGWSWAACRALVIEVGEALAHAHDLGRVHGGLCPEVIRIDGEQLPRPQITITGFGLAAIADRHDQREWRGSSPYTAPELHGGYPAHHGSDVYALGVLLWELAAGRRPFRPTRVPIFDAERRRATLLGRDCPSELDALLDLALAPDPDERFADIHEFLDTLQALTEPCEFGQLPAANTGWEGGELLSAISGLEPAALRLVRRHIDALLSGDN